MNMPSMEDVAREAGVHRTTVSLALRNHPRIPCCTRERVLAAAKKLGYHKNPLVSALMVQRRGKVSGTRSEAIAYLHEHPIPNDNTIHNIIFNAIKERAAFSGFNIDPIWLFDPGMRGKRLTKVLITRGIRGLVIGPRMNTLAAPVEIDWSRFVTGALYLAIDWPACDRVCFDFLNDFVFVLRKTREVGKTRVGVVTMAGRWDRFHGAWGGVLASECPGHVDSLLMEDNDGESVILAWVKKWKPDAVIINSSEHAGREIRKVLSSISRAPEIFDMEITEAPPGSQGLRAEWAELGRTVVDVVVGGLLRNEVGLPASPKTIMLRSAWV